MGSGSFSSKDWKAYATNNNYDTKSTKEIFSSTKLDSALDPKGVIRESRDNDDKEPSNAIIVALDVTGSMGILADTIARQGLNTMCTEIYGRKPVTDPQIMCMGIGDVEIDSAPIQATQFEADIRIATQLEKIFIEGGGGGNSYESYAGAWYFAARHTKTDCFEKRGKKGYLFTVGDEKPTPRLFKKDLQRVFGDGIQEDINMEALLTEVSREWEVFHIVVEEGSYCKQYPNETRQAWRDLLGQRAIMLSDHKKLAEVIVSTIQICEGTDNAKVVDSWDGHTKSVVAHATSSLTVGSNKTDGVVTL